MKTLTIEYPESLPDALHLSASEFEREAKLAMAAKLFDRGRLTSGQAADLAGIPRIHFLYEIGRWAVSSLQTPADELAEDAAVARRLYDRHQH